MARLNIDDSTFGERVKVSPFSITILGCLSICPPSVFAQTDPPVKQGDTVRITSIPVQNVMQAALYQFQVQAVDVEGDAFTFSLALAPTFLSIDPLNGLITGIPQNANVGEHTVIVDVRDTIGDASTQSYG